MNVGSNPVRTVNREAALRRRLATMHTMTTPEMARTATTTRAATHDLSLCMDCLVASIKLCVGLGGGGSNCAVGAGEGGCIVVFLPAGGGTARPAGQDAEQVNESILGLHSKAIQ